jgi:hypothetical protein
MKSRVVAIGEFRSSFFPFLENARDMCFIVLRKVASIVQVFGLWPGTEKLHLFRTPNGLWPTDYLSSPRLSNAFAPGLAHCSASALMIIRRLVTVAEASLKHRALRSFYSCHDTSVKRESKPFFCWHCRCRRKRLHHVSTERCTSGSWRPKALQMWNHTSLVNGQQHRIWSIVSGAWSQR